MMKPRLPAKLEAHKGMRKHRAACEGTYWAETELTPERLAQHINACEDQAVAYESGSMRARIWAEEAERRWTEGEFELANIAAQIAQAWGVAR